MVTSDVPSPDQALGARARQSEELSFLWLELTSTCNLECVHCYADSGPLAGRHDRLTADDYSNLLSEARRLGCVSVQFIGGEPTTFPGLEHLIGEASDLGFEFVEVYTNATHLSSSLLSVIQSRGICVATSFYCDDAAIHDTITGRSGSHQRTVKTLARLQGAQVPLRVGVISMPQNERHIESTLGFLRQMGIDNISVDRSRAVGRASAAGRSLAVIGGPASRAPTTTPDRSAMEPLCGHCHAGRLCVTPSGAVFPCVMSRSFNVGSVPNQSLQEILRSDALSCTRGNMRDFFEERERVGVRADCSPFECAPKSCRPDCLPGLGCKPMRNRLGPSELRL